MLDKFMIGLTGLAIAGTVVVNTSVDFCFNIDQQQNKNYFMADVMVPYGKKTICFQNEGDYQTFKLNTLAKIKNGLPNKIDNTLAYVENFIELESFWVLINEEIGRGNINGEEFLKSLLSGDYTVASQELDSLFSSNNIVQMPR